MNLIWVMPAQEEKKTLMCGIRVFYGELKMRKVTMNAYGLLERVRKECPVVHHLTNWVTIYDCANVVKVLGASPVMAHAKDEVAAMVQIASSLVLNIGTLTVDFIEAMKAAARSANKKGIPVILDVCGAGATPLRTQKSFELLDEVRVDIIKGNASEIARIAGEDVLTKGVDAANVNKNMIQVVRTLVKKRRCTVVVTGKEDIVASKNKLYIVKNGHPLMSHVVGTGCMATSVIGAFIGVEDDYALASASGLVCFEIAAECAVKGSGGPGTFKVRFYDCLYHLDKRTISRMQRVEA